MVATTRASPASHSVQYMHQLVQESLAPWHLTAAAAAAAARSIATGASGSIDYTKDRP